MKTFMLSLVLCSGLAAAVAVPFGSPPHVSSDTVSSSSDTVSSTSAPSTALVPVETRSKSGGVVSAPSVSSLPTISATNVDIARESPSPTQKQSIRAPEPSVSTASLSTQTTATSQSTEASSSSSSSSPLGRVDSQSSVDSPVSPSSTPQPQALSLPSTLPNAQNKAASKHASPSSALPFTEIAHVSAATETPKHKTSPKPTGELTNGLDPNRPEDPTGPVARNIVIVVFGFLTVAAIVCCFKDKIVAKYRRIRNRRADTKAALISPWTQTGASSEKQASRTSFDEGSTAWPRNQTAYSNDVTSTTPGLAYYNNSPLSRVETLPAYNYPSAAEYPSSSTESLASRVTERGMHGATQSNPGYRYGPYVAKPQPDFVVYR